MIVGLYFDNLKNLTLIKWFKVPALTIFYFIFPLGMVPFFTSYIFYNYNVNNTAWWIGVWTIFSKHFWGLLGISIVFVFTNNLDSKYADDIFNYIFYIKNVGNNFFSGFLRKVLYAPVWQPLGTYTYIL